MGIFSMILLFSGAILIGQIIKEYANSKVFYRVHLFAIVFVFLWGFIVSLDASGGVLWPFWVLPKIYVPPIIGSLLVGLLGDWLKRRKEKL